MGVVGGSGLWMSVALGVAVAGRAVVDGHGRVDVGGGVALGSGFGLVAEADVFGPAFEHAEHGADDGVDELRVLGSLGFGKRDTDAVVEVFGRRGGERREGEEEEDGFHRG